MAIIKWSPFFSNDPFNEVDQIMENVGFPMTRGKGFVPAMDVYQTKDAVLCETPLPGIDPKDIEVNIENDVLTIKGENHKQTEVDEKDYYRKEVRYGSFYRSVQLPTHVKADQTEAEYKDGILKITLPKAEEVKSKAIKVKVK